MSYKNKNRMATAGFCVQRADGRIFNPEVYILLVSIPHKPQLTIS